MFLQPLPDREEDGKSLGGQSGELTDSNSRDATRISCSSVSIPDPVDVAETLVSDAGATVDKDAPPGASKAPAGGAVTLADGAQTSADDVQAAAQDKKLLEPPNDGVQAPKDNVPALFERTKGPTDHAQMSTDGAQAAAEDIAPPNEQDHVPAEDVQAPAEDAKVPTDRSLTSTDDVQAAAAEATDTTVDRVQTPTDGVQKSAEDKTAPIQPAQAPTNSVHAAAEVTKTITGRVQAPLDDVRAPAKGAEDSTNRAQTANGDPSASTDDLQHASYDMETGLKDVQAPSVDALGVSDVGRATPEGLQVSSIHVEISAYGGKALPPDGVQGSTHDVLDIMDVEEVSIVDGKATTNGGKPAIDVQGTHVPSSSDGVTDASKSLYDASGSNGRVSSSIPDPVATEAAVDAAKTKVEPSHSAGSGSEKPFSDLPSTSRRSNSRRAPAASIGTLRCLAAVKEAEEEVSAARQRVAKASKVLVSAREVAAAAAEKEVRAARAVEAADAAMGSATTLERRVNAAPVSSKRKRKRKAAGASSVEAGGGSSSGSSGAAGAAVSSGDSYDPGAAESQRSRTSGETAQAGRSTPSPTPNVVVRPRSLSSTSGTSTAAGLSGDCVGGFPLRCFSPADMCVRACVYMCFINHI